MRYYAAAGLISLCGLAVLASWYGLLPVWLQYGAGEVSMKAVTAGGFGNAGLLLAAMIAERRNPASRWAWGTLAALSVLMVANSLCLLWGHVTHTPCGLVAYFPTEAPGAALTGLSGQPSFGTSLGFFLLAWAGVCGLSRRLWFLAVWQGAAVLCLGAAGVIGWGLRLPALYWYAGVQDTAMALPTAALFAACGALLVLVAAEYHADDREG